MLCSCQSGQTHEQCCQPLHLGETAPNALALMRSRYTAYMNHNIDYIIKTTIPAQQTLLNVQDLLTWSHSVQWQGLEIIQHSMLSKRHQMVAFKAYFLENQQVHTHHEHSLFALMNQRWYFIDPTVPLPSAQTACLCGSARQFKYCCGKWLSMF